MPQIVDHKDHKYITELDVTIGVQLGFFKFTGVGICNVRLTIIEYIPTVESEH